MKRMKLLAIGMLTISLLFCISCSKQDSVLNPYEQTEKFTMSEADISIMNKIITFKEKVKFIKENPENKSGEVMMSDDAIWNMETLFNVTYGFPNEQYGATKADTTILQINVNNDGEVILIDVVNKYDEIVNIVTQYYYNCGFENKGFLLLDLEKGDISNGQMKIILRSVTGKKDENWEPFGPDDDWLYGYSLGRCDYTQDTTDAAEEIQKAVNGNKPLIYPQPGYRFVYIIDDQIAIDYEDITDYPTPENPPPANYMDYLIFYCTQAAGTFTPGVEDCLSPDEMNFHFEGEKTVIYEKLPIELNKPTNWVFMECIIEGILEYDINGNSIMFHKNYLTYAYLYVVPVGEIEQPKEL